MKPIMVMNDLVVGYPRGFRLGPINEVTTSGITCLIGPNGAGKSTLLRSLAGLQAPLHGHVRRSSPSVGYLPQDFVPPQKATSAQFLHYVAWLYDIDRGDRADEVERALERVQLTDHADTEIGELSGGMQRRLGVAHTLVSGSDLVLLDEPTVGLDPLQVSAMVPTLRTISGELGVWVSTHQLNVARALADRLLVLGGSRVRFSGVVADLPSVARSSEEGFDTWVRDLMLEHAA